MRSLSDVTASTLTTLAAFWLALFAVAGAAGLLLDPSVDTIPVQTPLLVGWLAAGVAFVSTLLLPQSARAAALLTITLALAATTVVARELTGLVAPWLLVTVAGGLVVTSFGFLTSHRFFPLVAILAVGLVLAPQRVDEFTRGNSPVRLGVPLMEATLIIGLGLLAVLIRSVLMQSARRADRILDETRRDRLAALAERSREDALSAQMSLLHDTALNTLDALALRPGAADADLRQRCLDDAGRLQAVGEQQPESASWLTQAVQALVQRSTRLGLNVTVDVDVDDDARVPRPVVQAFVGAAEEALLNISKHAGTTHVRVRLHTAPEQACLVVSDDGRGFDPDEVQTGFGTRFSIAERMAAVGGSSAVASRPGEGTSVALTWQPPDEQSSGIDEMVGATVLRLLVVFVAATTVFTAGLVVAERDAFERPGIALLGGLLLGGWGLLVTWVLQRRRWIPASVGVITVLLACLAPFWTVSADQYCASSFGGIGWIDPRLPLVVLVILAAGHWWHAAAALPAFLVATVAAGWIWGQAFPGCDTWAITGATYAAAILGAALFAGRTLNRQSAQMWQASVERDEAQEASLRATALRAEQQQWLAPAVSSCVPLLSQVGTGTADLADEQVRRRCRTVSGYLRSLITVAGAPPGVRDGLREIVQCAHSAGLDVTVRGDPRALPAPRAGLTAALQRLPSDLSGADSMVITALAADGGGSVIIHVPGLRVTRTDTERMQRHVEGAEVDLDDVDGWWMEVSWSAVGQPAPAVSS